MFKWIGLAVLCLLVPVSAQAQQSTLSPADYEEIRGLYARYCYGFDNGDSEMVAGVYAADATFLMGGKVMGDSREKIAANVRPPAAGSPASKHVPSNIVIEPSSDGATGTSYVVLMAFETGKAPVVTGGGSYASSFVKTPDGWRFKSRNYTPFGSHPAATTP